MAYRHEHIEDCIEELGEGFDYVHDWLNEFYLSECKTPTSLVSG